MEKSKRLGILLVEIDRADSYGSRDIMEENNDKKSEKRKDRTDN